MAEDGESNPRQRAGTLNINKQKTRPAAFRGFLGLTPAGLTTASGALGPGIFQSSINGDDQFLNLLLDPTVLGSPAASQGRAASPVRRCRRRGPMRRCDPATVSERKSYAMATKAPLLASLPPTAGASGRPAWQLRAGRRNATVGS